MLMKNKFQSLTEKGRWLLATLTLIFTLGIGQMWGDAASWMNNSMTPAAYFTLGSNTSAAANAKTISDVNYTHSINMTSASNQSSNKTNGYFISFTLTSASNVSVLFGANGGGRNLRINTGWSYDEKTNATQLANGATPSNGIKITSDQVANGKYGTVGIDNLAAGTYYICGNGSVSIYKITISNAGGGNTDTEAPAFVSSVPADGAEDVAVEGTIVLAFDEDIASVDASKFTLTGATKGTVAVDGTDAKKVNVAYSNAENSATVKLETAAEAVADAAGNKSVALDDISFTTEAASTGGEEPADNCSKIFAFANTADVPTGITNSTSTFTGFSTGGNNCTGEITIDGTKYTISKRGGNSTFSMTFSVPSGKVGTLYGLANSSGSSARTLTLTGPNDYSQQQSTSAASGSAAAITFTDMPAGAYTLAASGGASTPMLCLKLCDVPKYTVTINPNGGSYASAPEGWTLSAGVYTKEVEGGNFSAPAGLAKGTDDLSWKDNKGNDIEFPVVIDKDTTFIAQWAAHATSSNANLSALSVAGCELNETFAAATTAYTIDLPFYASMPAASAVSATKADANASDPVVSIEGNVISIVVTPESGAADKKTYTITVNIAAAPAASSSINIEQGVLDHGKGWGYAAALSDAHIAIVDADALDSINESKDYRNEPFLGLKFKKATSQFTIVVPASTELKVKFGSINSDAGLTSEPIRLPIFKCILSKKKKIIFITIQI